MGNRFGLEIRAATAADAAGLAELLREAGVVADAAGLAERVEALSAHGTAILAVEWGPPSGVVALHWHRTLLGPRPVAQIDLLLVGADARRRGVARLLVKAAGRTARQAGCEALHLLAPPAAHDLRAFCAATGFAPEADRWVRPLRKGG